MIFYSCIWFPFSLAQGFAIMPIVAVLVLPAIIILELVFAPLHAVHAFYIMVVTERLGINLKLLGVLILPLTFFAIPFVNILLCLLAVIVITPFSMVAANTQLNTQLVSSPNGGKGSHGLISCIFFGGALTVFKFCVQGVCDAVDMHRHTVKNGLNEFKTLRTGEEKFDAKFIQVVIGFIQAVLSIAILLAVNSVVGLVKLPFIIIKSYFRFCNVEWGTFCCFAVGFVPLIAPAIVIVYAASIFLNVQWGVFCAMRAYDEGSVGAGIELLRYCLGFYNSATNELLFGDQDRNYVYWPKAKRNLKREEYERRRAERIAVSMRRVKKSKKKKSTFEQEESEESRTSMMAVWANFFYMSSVEISKSIQKGLVSNSEIDSLEPFLFTGVASIVCFKCALRSLAKHGPQDKFEVGRDCTALWPSAKQKYYPGKITAVDEERKVCDILFDDGDTLDDCHF